MQGDTGVGDTGMQGDTGVGDTGPQGDTGVGNTGEQGDTGVGEEKTYTGVSGEINITPDPVVTGGCLVGLASQILDRLSALENYEP